MNRYRTKTGLIVLDILLLSTAYFFMARIKSGAAYLSDNYLIGFGFTVVVWVLTSFYLKKYHPHKREKMLFFLRIIVIPNLITLAILSFVIYGFGTTYFSRLMVFGTLGIATFLEFLFFGLYTYAIRSKVIDDATAFLEKPPSAHDKKRMTET